MSSTAIKRCGAVLALHGFPFNFLSTEGAFTGDWVVRTHYTNGESLFITPIGNIRLG